MPHHNQGRGQPSDMIDMCFFIVLVVGVCFDGFFFGFFGVCVSFVCFILSIFE